MNPADIKLLTAISHEFKTPLHSINCVLESLQEEPTSMLIKNKLSIIQSSHDYLNQALNDIINFCQQTEISKTESLDIIDLSELITRLQHNYSRNQNRNAIITKLHVKGSFRGNKMLISSIIGKSINNSLSYTKNGVIKIIAKVLEEKNGFVLS